MKVKHVGSHESLSLSLSRTPCISLSVFSSICPFSLFVFLGLFLYLSFSLFVFLTLSFSLFVFLSICLSLFVFLTLSFSLCLSHFLSFSICFLSLHPPVVYCLSLCLNVNKKEKIQNSNKKFKIFFRFRSLIFNI